MHSWRVYLSDERVGMSNRMLITVCVILFGLGLAQGYLAWGTRSAVEKRCAEMMP